MVDDGEDPPAPIEIVVVDDWEDPPSTGTPDPSTAPAARPVVATLTYTG